MHYEQTIRRKKTTGDRVFEIFLILVSLIFFSAGIYLLGILGPILAIILIAVLVLVIIPRSRIEYEYVLDQGTLTISVITNNKNREEMLSVFVRDAKIIAPKNSARFDGMERPKHFYTAVSGNKGARVFALLTEHEDGYFCYLFEPDEELQKQLQIACGSIYSSD